MTWKSFHNRGEILRSVTAAANTRRDGLLPMDVDGDGHTGYNSGNECVDSAVEDYLVDGTVPDDGLEC